MTALDDIPMEGELKSEDLEIFRQASRQDQLMAIAQLHRDREDHRFNIQRFQIRPTDITIFIALAAFFFSSVSFFIQRDELSLREEGHLLGLALFMPAALFVWMISLSKQKMTKAHTQLRNISMRLAAYERIFEERTEQTGGTFQRLLTTWQAGFRSLMRAIR